MKSPIRTVVFLLLAVITSSVHAQTTIVTPDGEQVKQLDVVYSVLEAKMVERKELREQILVAEPDDIADLEIELNEINVEIVELRQTFEQIAVGSVDLGIFNNENGEFNWRTEMTDVMMPIIRNLQSLTEKPRKIEALRSTVEENKEQLIAANIAVAAIDESIALAKEEATKNALAVLQESWTEQVEEIQRSTDVARVKLINLQESNDNIFESIKSGLIDFITGRGLTLLLAVAAALAVRYTAKYITKLLLAKNRREAAKTYRTRQRLVRYGFNILTGLLMTIAVVVVFYVRGDVLLLGLVFLIAGAAILGLRHAIPKFISEARILLNLGSIREDERVMYNGLPYKVTALNMYSILNNPELTGVVRLPLENMMGMISRPSGKEIWFPASKGDFIMLDGNLLEVIALTTELVQLQNLVGNKSSVPTADFYNMTFDNITRGDKFGVVGTFGVSYAHQRIANDDIPVKFKKSIENALAETDFSEHVISVTVELKEAGASSLDIMIYVTMSNVAIRMYYKVGRMIQQACVATCTKEEWDIPFPQLTVHNQ